MQQKQKISDLIAKTLFGAICAITCATCALFLFTGSALFPTSTPPAFGWDDIPVDAEAGIDFDSGHSPFESRPDLTLNDQSLTRDKSKTENDPEIGTITVAELIAEEIPERIAIEFKTSEFGPSGMESPVDLFPKIQVSSIFYDLPRPAAKINGQVLHAGDSISGAKVIEISQENIVIQHEGKRRSFTLK